MTTDETALCRRVARACGFHVARIAVDWLVYLPGNRGPIVCRPDWALAGEVLDALAQRGYVLDLGNVPGGWDCDIYRETGLRSRELVAGKHAASAPLAILKAADAALAGEGE